MWQLIIMLLSAALDWPLRYVYFHGPVLYGYGFWEGQSHSDICASITGIAASHWDANAIICKQRIERKFQAFACMFYILLLLHVTYSIVHFYMTRKLLIAPLLNALSRNEGTVGIRTHKPHVTQNRDGGQPVRRVAQNRQTPAPE